MSEGESKDAASVTRSAVQRLQHVLSFSKPGPHVIHDESEPALRFAPAHSQRPFGDILVNFRLISNPLPYRTVNIVPAVALSRDVPHPLRWTLFPSKGVRTRIHCKLHNALVLILYSAFALKQNFSSVHSVVFVSRPKLVDSTVLQKSNTNIFLYLYFLLAEH